MSKLNDQAQVYKLTLRTQSKRAEISAVLKMLLNSCDIREEQIVEEIDRRSRTLTVYLPDQHRGQVIKGKLSRLGLKHVALKGENLSAAQWQNLWKKNIHPFYLSRRFSVIPQWAKRSRLKQRRTPISIDTTFAFGTGLHETTRFMAHLIERCRGRFFSFLDIGTGTGILSIVARHCEARIVDGVDLKQDVIQTAQANMKRNGFEFSRLEHRGLEHFSRRRAYDLVVANLVTDQLLRLKERIFRCVKKDGHLAVSGISLENLPHFRQEFCNKDFRCVSIVRGKMWAALLYRRRKPGV